MHFGPIANVGELNKFLATKAASYTKLVQDFVGAMESDTETAKNHGIAATYNGQLTWLSWHAVELPVAAVAAELATKILRSLEGMDVNAPVPASLKQSALDAVCRDMRLNSRSTSASSNLVEDATRAFWSELASLILKS